MKNQTKVTVRQDEQNPVPVEIIAQAIVDISAAMKRINQTRLTREALVTLIHDHSKVSKTTVRIVLNNLDGLEQTWLRKTLN